MRAETAFCTGIISGSSTECVQPVHLNSHRNSMLSRRLFANGCQPGHIPANRGQKQQQQCLIPRPKQDIVRWSVLIFPGPVWE
ncbi:hypothetical protein MHYP_G00026230 [Metynnis hypsauchen]